MVAARVDPLVLRRMRTLVDRAGRGVGPRCDEVADAMASAAIDAFHRRFYDAADTWRSATYRGVTIWKNPLDLWLYQEIVHALRPDLIVETGTAFGGSALYLADLCELVGTGRVITIDVGDRAGGVEHPRLTKIRGSSADAAIRREVDALVPDPATTLVILDADHTRDHVLAELRLWADLVSAGSYLIVEDTNLNGHPVYPDFGPGPWEAVDAFLAESNEFAIDDTMHRFLMTWNRRGFLKRR
jgi:cephalosporin hydroxylase